MTIWIKPSGLEIETNDRDATLEACVRMGWKLKLEPTGDTLNDGEKGNGEPGSIEWHESAIKGCSNCEEVEEYMRSIGIEMNASGQLKTVKKNAIKLIKEAINDNSF